jgi:hypothetical protein
MLETRLSENLPEQFRHSGLVQFVFRDPDHGVVELVLNLVIGDTLVAVDRKKGECRHDSHPLVSVDISLGFRQVEGIGRRHVEEITPAIQECVLSGSDGRLDQSGITNARGSTVILQAHRMQQVNLLQS